MFRRKPVTTSSRGPRGTVGFRIADSASGDTGDTGDKAVNIGCSRVPGRSVGSGDTGDSPGLAAAKFRYGPSPGGCAPDKLADE